MSKRSLFMRTFLILIWILSFASNDGMYKLYERHLRAAYKNRTSSYVWGVLRIHNDMEDIETAVIVWFSKGKKDFPLTVIILLWKNLLGVRIPYTLGASPAATACTCSCVIIPCMLDSAERNGLWSENTGNCSKPIYV